MCRYCIAMVFGFCLVVFFFKQKTAYEMRISDWSSDVCSSDLVQPHRYSRLHDLMGEFQTAFNDADMVFVAPVYAAGEAPIEGIDAQALVDGLKRRGPRSAAGVADADALAVWLAETIQPGDLVICLGAGDITNRDRKSTRL